MTDEGRFQKKDLDACVAALKSGGIILYPTDTIWGIGCDATNEEAVQKIIQLKKRKDNHAMIVLVDNEHRLDRYVKEIPLIAFQLIDVADKPLTIVYPYGQNLAPSVLSEDGSIGIRVTADRFCQELVKKLGKPLVSTSANVSGEKFSGKYTDISSEIIEGVNYVAEFRRNDAAALAPSQVIKLGIGGEISILRR